MPTGSAHERFARRMAYRHVDRTPRAIPPSEQPEREKAAPCPIARLRLGHVFAFLEENEDELISRSRERQITQRTTGNAVRQERMLKAIERGTHEQWEWWRLMCYYGKACAQCGSRERIHKDHIVPVSRGGSNGLENLQPLCGSCNLTKHDRAADYRWDNGEWVETVRLGWIVGE